LYGVLDCRQKGRIQYDRTTGEVVETVVFVNDNYSHTEEGVAVEDIKQNSRHYYMARDVEELEELCQYSVYDAKAMPIKHSEKMFCLLSRGELNPHTFYIFSLLSKYINRRNVAVMTKGELITILKTDAKNFSREVKRLEASGVIKVVAPQGNKNKQRNVLFHPALVWRGDYGLRNKLEKSILSSNLPWYEVVGFNTVFDKG